MLSYLIKNIMPKRRVLRTKTMENTEKEMKRELTQDLARADDDGFAIAKKIKRRFLTNKVR